MQSETKGEGTLRPMTAKEEEKRVNIEDGVKWIVGSWDSVPDEYKTDLRPDKYSLIENLSKEEHFVVLLVSRQKPSVQAYYDFDEERIGVTKKGQLIWGFDSGCSCPTPWQDSFPKCYNLSKTWKEFEINLKGIEISDAVRLLTENNINYEIEGPKKNSVVADQEIIYSDDASKNKIKLVTKSSNEQGNIPLKHDTPLIMPELKGMSIRKCVKILSSLGIEYKISGSGKVIQQSPEAGAKLIQNKQAEIKCSVN